MEEHWYHCYNQILVIQGTPVQLHSPAHVVDHGKMPPTQMGLSWMDQRKVGELKYLEGLVDLNITISDRLTFLSLWSQCSSHSFPKLFALYRRSFPHGKAGTVVPSQLILPS